MNMKYFAAFSDEEILLAFGTSLKKLREYKNLTQVGLAEVLDIPFQTLSTYERGRNTPSMTQALKIVRYFYLTIEDFIECGLKEIEEGDSDLTERYERALKEWD